MNLSLLFLLYTYLSNTYNYPTTIFRGYLFSFHLGKFESLCTLIKDFFIS